MKSIWEKNSESIPFPTIEEDKKTEVLIIGGGMVGVLCGYFLDRQGIDYTLIEKNQVASGVTKNTTAKITSQHGLIYGKIAKAKGIEMAKVYFDLNQKAIEQYRNFAREISCDFQEKTNFIYSNTNKQRIIEEAETLEILGGDVALMNINHLPIPMETAVGLGGQAQFNPLKFIGKISKGLHIHQRSFARSIEKEKNGWQVTVENHSGHIHRVRAKKVIVATHFPFMDKHGLYFLKMYQYRSYVMALESRENIGGMYIGDTEEDLSFRNYKNYLLIGGGGARTGMACGGFDRLKSFVDNHYPQHSIIEQWATQDCMTLDGIPYIGPYAKGLENIDVATGFNKWGMTTSMVAAMMLTGEMKQDSEGLFNPSRTMRKPQLFINGFQATKNMLALRKPRCTHLKCALKWNKSEKSWDCPCHGSRFDEEGNVVDNPAQKQIQP